MVGGGSYLLFKIIFFLVLFRELSAELLREKSQYSLNLIKISCLKRGGKIISITFKVASSIRMTLNASLGYKLIVRRRTKTKRSKLDRCDTPCIFKPIPHSFIFRDLRLVLIISTILIIN